MLLLKISEKLDFFFIIQLLVILYCQISTAPCEANMMGCVSNKSCSQTFEDVYNALASGKNYFNIAEALYPATKPSSVLVYVNLHVTKKENSTPVPYTWSKLCLYASLPTNVLEILSLGSILVAPRTQQLDITIPPFCCNVSEDERKAIFHGALASLEDLAVSPAIQDPRLNTAECVIEGHEASICATGRRSSYIRATLWLSLVFTFICGPTVALSALMLLKDTESEEDNSGKRKALVTAVKFSLVLILALEFSLVTATVIFSATGNATPEIYALLLIPILEGLSLGIFGTKKCIGFKLKKLPNFWKLVIFTCANLTTYHFSWLLIGTMLNPTWGLTVVLFVGVIFAAFIYAVYNYLLVEKEDFSLRIFIFYAVALLSVWLLVAVVILAGQSFFGRETADDVVKAVTLYFTTAFISWIASRTKRGDRSNSSNEDVNQEEQPLQQNNGLQLEPMTASV
ncbi:uncharacterized protein [Montipora foliosa]|uniref:uncharacterized protein n=1 Tax=Montipora foliosa TaxID=591990 RepID=UPI0035F1C81F